MKVTFVGTGYVGLVTGTCFSEVGHDVICVDVDQQKIDGLKDGKLPIFEPGLDELVMTNYQRGRLAFTTDLTMALSDSEVIFVGVGTPQRSDGSANLDYVWAVIDEIRAKATEPKIVVIKSTVPVGTNEKASQKLNNGNKIQHVVASNPEFLREGLAVDDALNPDRVVIGLQNHETQAKEKLETLYTPFSSQGVPVLFMSWESAEMTKYVANCVLATKISYINEMANMCEVVSADINDVRQGIGHDKRIGFQFFSPGVGYGGSCFPKDVRAMKALARSHKTPMRILEAVDYVNEEQKRVAFGKLNSAFNGHLTGTTITIWGIAFKPQTDDIREAPSIVLIRQLVDAGANIRVCDPEALENVQRELGDQVEYFEDPYSAVKDSDGLVIMTEWEQYKSADLSKVYDLMKSNVIVDGRNCFDSNEVSKAGFAYSSIGRVTTYPGFEQATVPNSTPQSAQ